MFEAEFKTNDHTFNSEFQTAIGTNNEWQSGYEKGYTDGREIWKYARNLAQMFEYAEFPKGAHIEINIPNLSSTTANYMFRSATGVEKITLKCNRRGKAMNWHGAFSRCYDLKVIDLSEFDTTIGVTNDFFYDCKNLEEIHGEINNTVPNWTLWFKDCKSLKEIRFAPNSIKGGELKLDSAEHLSIESIKSIVEGLVDLTESTAATVIFHASAKAKLTNEQLATIAGKNWILR